MELKTFSRKNRKRCESRWHRLLSEVGDPSVWGVEDWALALCGEAGELANLVKKVKRGDFTLDEAKDDIAKEAADVVTYADLLCQAIERDLGEELRKKFDEVSARVGYEDNEPWG